MVYYLCADFEGEAVDSGAVVVQYVPSRAQGHRRGSALVLGLKTGNGEMGKGNMVIIQRILNGKTGKRKMVIKRGRKPHASRCRG